MKPKTKGIISILFGAVSLLFISLPWLLILFGILSIIFGFKANKEKQKKLGMAGMTLGIISLLLIILYFLSFLIIGNSPLFVFESCSMYHESSFDKWWNKEGNYYEQQSITKEQFQEFPLKNGFEKGDLLFVLSSSQHNIGEVIMFLPSSRSKLYPIAHRIIVLNPIGTKGDHNLKQLTSNNNAGGLDETNISQEKIIGKVKFKIPYLGWAKLLFLEPLKPKTTRGFCK